MKETLKRDTNFEDQKKQVEDKNRQQEIKELNEKFNVLLMENPIEIYAQYPDDNPIKKGIKINAVKNLIIDQLGEGGVSVVFNNDEFIGVNKNGVQSSLSFNSERSHNKILNDSFQNILTIMNESIKISGCSDDQKNMMFQAVINSLKNKVLEEDSSKEEKV